ncbi:MAG TPA: DUF5668 domain-containing protein [Vicinamibacteria bacterium]
MMDETQIQTFRNRLSPRLVVGFAVMILGALLTLDNLGLFEVEGLWRYWPVVLILLGIAKFVQRADVFGALVWIAAGGALLAANLGLIQVKQLWPLALLVVGARLVLGAMAGEGASSCRQADGLLRVTRGQDDADRIDAFAMLGGTVRGTNSTAFRSGAATAFMGGCEIDLRRAKIAGAEAVFDAFAMWGGVEIKVPEDWAVENRGMGLLGGFVDSTRRPVEPKGRLVLSGIAIMGGVEAKN